MFEKVLTMSAGSEKCKLFIVIAEQLSASTELIKEIINIISHKIDNININEKNEYLNQLNKIYIHKLLADENKTENDLRNIFQKVLTISKEYGRHERLIDIAKQSNVSLELIQEIKTIISREIYHINKRDEYLNKLNICYINKIATQLLNKLQDRTLSEEKLKEITEIALTTEISCEKYKRSEYNILVAVVKHPNSTISLAEKIREHISNDKTIHKDIQMLSLSRMDKILKTKELERCGGEFKNLSASKNNKSNGRQ